ncbi:MAG: hypothetical protein EBR60_09625 [Burkholderiaceae bacterium]|nr:hypothetical protein [Burkholderiaceae bacterium]
MAQSLDIYIDTTNGNLVAAGSARDGTLKTFTRNDSYNIRVRLQERDSNGFLRDLDTTGSSLKLGIGGIDADPIDGQFKLILNAVTSTAISFNATTAQLYNAISAIAGTGVLVTTYGSEQYAYLITSATANSAMSFGASAFTLFPTTSVIVNTRRFPAPSVNAQQIIKLVRNPAVYADTFVASPTAGVVSLTNIQDGSATQNETYSLAVGPDAEGGSVILNFGANSTTAIPIGSNAASFAEALSSVTGIGSGNISVDLGNNAGNYSISFVRALGSTAITTPLTLDASGVIFGKFLQSVVTFATAELDELFAEQGTNTVTPTLEIELVQAGSPKTVLQTDVTIRRDLISTGSAVPAAQASYLTASESYAAFVANSTTGVNSLARGLADSSAVTSVAFGSRTLNNSSGTAVVSYGAGLSFANTPMGFYGATVTAKPSGVNIVSGLTNLGLLSYTQPTAVNVVSGLINTGLIASGVSYGVLPQSPYTVTTLASVTFGTVAGNDQHYRDVVVTGAAVNDIVLVGLPSAISAGAVIQGVAYKANTVCLSCVNADSVSRDVNTATYRITVIGY